MRFLLRTTFWLGVVLVLLPSSGSEPVPKSQVNASEALLAAKAAMTDIEHFCDRQPESCAVGSQTAVKLGQLLQAGAKMLYGVLNERSGSNEPKTARNTASVPLPLAKPPQHTLRSADLVPPWRDKPLTDTPRDQRPAKEGEPLS